MTDAAITRIIPPGAPLPARPPGPPPPTLPGDWWRPPPAPPASRPPVPPPYVPPPPAPIDVHVTVTVGPSEEEKPPAWWRRIRWGYNAGCLLCAGPLAAPWASVLASVRDSQGLAGAWTLAVIPLAVLALLDNGRRIEAAAAHPDLWAPKLRAARARILLDATLIATATALPVTTAVYLTTGVRP
ncbi:hypothetical protein ACFWBI_09025 [Streptomyces sp. NPDC059982]|uniref:hypothetical protein n=1 Tax=unclassified Streptomyces TaxID=2593676 RepID=UPI0036BC3804